MGHYQKHFHLEQMRDLYSRSGADAPPTWLRQATGSPFSTSNVSVFMVEGSNFVHFSWTKDHDRNLVWMKVSSLPLPQKFIVVAIDGDGF